MDLLKYIKTIPNLFKKADLQETLSLITKDLNMHTIPAARAACGAFPNDKFKSEQVNEFVKQYKRLTAQTSRMSTLSHMLSVFENALEVLGVVTEHSSRIFSENESGQALTYEKTSILKFVNTCNFASNLYRDFLNYVYYLESKELDSTINSSPTAAEIKEIKENFMNFCYAMNTLSVNKDEFIKSLQKMPDADVSDNSDSVLTNTLGLSKLDPFNMRFLNVNAFSVKWNIFYWVATRKAQKAASAYKQNKQQLELLQLRKFNLEKLNSKNNDAKLEKEIEYLQDRISSLAYKIKQDEESYGI